MKTFADKDVISGLMFVAIGVFGLAMSLQFDFGSTRSPGPGFFPNVLSVLLILIGVGVAAKGLMAATREMPSFVWRPLVLIPLAVLLFALAIGPLGLALAVFLAALTATFARPGYGTLPRVVTAAGLTLFSALLFVAVLQLPIPLWPV